MIGEGPGARSIKLDLPPFTLVGATTRAGLLTSPLRDRFGIVQRLEFYTAEELTKIVIRSASILQAAPATGRSGSDCGEIARYAAHCQSAAAPGARLSPRSRPPASSAVKSRWRRWTMLEVDPEGFDMLDRKLLLTVIEKFEGGPVGVDSLAAAMSEERGTVEDVIEPFLIQQGFLMRTARGRIATRAAYAHFRLAAPAMERDLNLPLFRDSQ